MEMQPQTNYEILGVPGTATADEIKAAFRKLVTDFHAAGKPKNIDDVEWLRRVVHAYHALGDGSNDENGGVGFGYDNQRIEGMSRAVDNEITLRRSKMLARALDGALAEFICAILS